MIGLQLSRFVLDKLAGASGSGPLFNFVIHCCHIFDIIASDLQELVSVYST